MTQEQLVALKAELDNYVRTIMYCMDVNKKEDAIFMAERIPGFIKSQLKEGEL